MAARNLFATAASDSRIKLWVACQALLYSWHSNQNETDPSSIEANAFAQGLPFSSERLRRP
jgi:hypothetical protein